MLKNTNRSWGAITRLFHWVLGLAIIGMIAYGWWMNHIPARPDRYFYRSIHADIGYAILLLLSLRLIWRLLNPTPKMPDGTPRWEHWLARLNQGALYLATFIVLMLGWAHSGAVAKPYASWFGLFDVPQFTSTDRAMAHLYEDYHIYAAYTLLALIVFHVFAALYHHFYKRDRVLKSMMTGQKI